MGQYTTLADALSDLLEKKRLSNAAAGKKLGGISGQLIGQYKLGNRMPKLDFYTKWKKTFGEDLQKLIESNVSDKSVVDEAAVMPSLQEYIAELKADKTYFKELVKTNLVNIDTNLTRLVEGLLNSAESQKPSGTVEVEQDEHSGLLLSQTFGGKLEAPGPLDEQGNPLVKDKLNKVPEKKD